MGKLTDLKEWLTVADAAKHISIAYGEDVTEADVLRLGLDGQLRLSVYFVNGVEAYEGVFLPPDEAFGLIFPDAPYPQELERHCKEMPAYERGSPVLHERNIEDDLFVTITKNVTSLTGVWDLSMLGAERTDIERRYQSLTGGPTVKPGTRGVYVNERSGRTYQVQDNSRLEGHYSADALSDDAVIVVRTEYLRELESPEANVQAGTSHANRSDQLAIMNQASFRFWSKAERTDRGTHPDNATVAEWLIERRFSKSTANIAASIIRPEWAPVGRKPEE